MDDTNEDDDFAPTRTAVQRAPPAKASKQDPALVSRVLELMQQNENCTLADIDRTLHAEGFENSAGRPWPRSSDGGVLCRILAANGLPLPPRRGAEEKKKPPLPLPPLPSNGRHAPIAGKKRVAPLVPVRPAATARGSEPTRGSSSGLRTIDDGDDFANIPLKRGPPPPPQPPQVAQRTVAIAGVATTAPSTITMVDLHPPGEEVQPSERLQTVDALTHLLSHATTHGTGANGPGLVDDMVGEEVRMGAQIAAVHGSAAGETVAGTAAVMSAVDGLHPFQEDVGFAHHGNEAGSTNMGAEPSYQSDRMDLDAMALESETAACDTANGAHAPKHAEDICEAYVGGVENKDESSEEEEDPAQQDSPISRARLAARAAQAALLSSVPPAIFAPTSMPPPMQPAAMAAAAAKTTSLPSSFADEAMRTRTCTCDAGVATHPSRPPLSDDDDNDFAMPRPAVPSTACRDGPGSSTSGPSETRPRPSGLSGRAAGRSDLNLFASPAIQADRATGMGRAAGNRRAQPPPAPAAVLPPTPLPAQRGDSCPFCREAWQRWGAHAIVSIPCGHTFGEVCLLAHLQHEKAAGRKHALCPLCRAPIKKGREDVWRLYVSNQDEATSSPGKKRRAAELERERRVEEKALHAAEARAQLAEQALTKLKAEHGKENKIS